MQQTLIADGTVRLVYRHMAFLGEESVRAATASECAADQGRFWEYHDAIFENATGRGQAAFSAASLKRYASDVGIERQAFDACVDSQRYVDYVRSETNLARQQGISRTPSLVIDGRLLAAVPSFEELRQQILAAR